MKKIILILVFLPFFACSDQIETNYKTFDLAKENHFFEKGWIPNDVVFKSMKNIYLKNNIDTNSAVFYFSISEMDLNKIQMKLKLENDRDIQIRSLEIPAWWESKIKELPKYSLQDENNIKVNIAVNKKTNEIFGWRDDH